MILAGLVLSCAVAQAQTPPRDLRRTVTAGTAVIRGTVVSDEAQPKPLRRARVTLDGGAISVRRTAITADDGSFAFEGLPAAEYTLGAIRAAYVAMKFGATRPARPGTPVSLRDGETRTITLRLPKGAVVTGVVTDPAGEPMQGVSVAAQTYRFIAWIGQRRLSMAGEALTDDRGVYRIYGLPAGEYMISASPSRTWRPPQRVMKPSNSAARSVTVASVFYPSAIDPERAARITLAAGQERTGVDVQIQYVPLATISGVVTTAAGSVPPMLALIRTSEALGAVEMGIASVRADGQFWFVGIPPGSYTIYGRDPSGLTWGSTDLVVDGEDIANVSLSMVAPLAISGRVVFEGADPPTDLTLSVQLPLSSEASGGNPQPGFQLTGGGRFTIAPLAPGVYRLPYVPAMQGIRSPLGKWWLKSIVVDGRDLLDAPLEIRQGTEDAVITLSAQASEVSGVVRDAQAAPVSDTYVVLFSGDRSFWFVGSRRIAGVRTDREGRYAIRNLPPGEYRIAATRDVDQGEWFDSSVLERLLATASPIAVAGVDRKTRDLVIR